MAEPTITELQNMGLEEFTRLVDKNLRSPDAGIARLLFQPEIIDRYMATIQSCLRSVEGQLAARAAGHEGKRARFFAAGGNPDDWLVERAAYSEWRAGALRYKTGLEQALVEIKAKRNEMRDVVWTDIVTEERDRLAAKVFELQEAIRRHKDGFPPEDEPSDCDLRLWKAVGL